MNEIQRKECHEHAWKHFTIHAQQRMTSVQFFIALCTVIVGGILVLIKDAPNTKVAVPLAFALPVFAFVFWKLDERSRQLLGAAEAALKHLENNGSGIEDVGGASHTLKVFSVEEEVTNKLKEK